MVSRKIKIALLGLWAWQGAVGDAPTGRAQHFNEKDFMQPVLLEGQYRNPVPTVLGLQGSRWEAVKEWFGGKQVREPAQPFPVYPVDIARAFPKGKDGIFATWLGHSSVLLQIGGARVAIDPVLGTDVSPVPWLYSIRRFQEKSPVQASELPELDAVFLTHDHYDHLDKASVLALASRTRWFVAPRGVGDLLVSWGIGKEKVRQLTWWQRDSLQTMGGITLRFTCAPSRHFSGRGLWSQNSTLWASWALEAGGHKVFHSGDSGYGPHFRQIGDRLGPFNLVFMENGQYNMRWKDIHMTPEESVQAFLDVRGGELLPVHWGAFNLSIHDWWEPIERAVAAAGRQGVSLRTPRIGQTWSLQEPVETPAWWRALRDKGEAVRKSGELAVETGRYGVSP